MSKKLKIFITPIKKNGKYELELRDNEGNEGIDELISKARPKSRVGWIPRDNREEDLKIKKLVKIAAKDGSDDIFMNGPKPSRGKKWRGIVAKDAKGKKEDYFIEYRLKGDDTIYYCDPSIVVKGD